MARRMAVWSVFGVVTLWGSSQSIELYASETTAADDEGLRFFEKHVRPLFAKYCFECHGEEKQESSLRLDTVEGLLRGGDTGPLFVAGEPDQSFLMLAVSYEDEDLQMPPEQKLTAVEIETLKRWIARGAPHPKPKTTVSEPRAMDLTKGREFWAFQSPQRPKRPSQLQTNWPRTGLDVFVLAALEKSGLVPAPPSDRRTWIRRATFNVTGLPPTPDQVRRFLADESPLARVRVIDRLLSSPHYGQRWARHWLDVARYADSNGLDENIHHGSAWRYRDYVVKSLNADKPFALFLREQLAGDLLITDSDDESLRHERLTATAFLSLGPKVLAEPDARKMEMDIIDEQIDTVGRAFLGLTLGCARCHDHKFDPILAADYYGLAGIFKSTRTMENFREPGKLGQWWENAIPTAAERAAQRSHRSRVAMMEAKLKQAIRDADAAVDASGESSGETDRSAKYPAETKEALKKLREELDKLTKAAPSITTVMGVQDQDVEDVAIHLRGSYQSLGEVIRRRFPLVLAGDSQDALSVASSGRLEMAEWMTSRQNPLTSRVIVNRVWRWHFGRGIVETPDNFGQLGARPTNQPLLDWLAVELMDSDWSLKRLHRQILLSRTFGQSSDAVERARETDPENRLFGRTNVRRLEAEVLRDAILAVSGRLDPRIGGSILTMGNRAYFFDHTSKDKTDYRSRRRSLYLPVVRNHLYEVFSLFDYADAGSVVGHRTTSTVAPQALFLLNSDFMREASESLVARLPDDGTDAERLTVLSQIVWNRDPSPREVTRLTTFLEDVSALAEGTDDAEKRRESWRIVCHAALSSNEFHYVR